MANNIFLTKKCNLSCPYCFASEFIDSNSEEFSLENFKKVVDFITRDSEQLGLIGGEPTLYSHFDDVLDILINNHKIKTVTLYTNGLLIDKYTDKLADKKFRILINCNSEKNLGETLFSKLKDNIQKLSEIKKENLFLGINVYDGEYDYSYIFPLLKLTSSKVLRISYSLKNIQKENTDHILDEFNSVKPIFIKLFEQCLENRIIPSFDCNSIPYCLYDNQERKLLMKIVELSKELNINYSLVAACSTCEPVLDIFPDLFVGRCFGMAKYEKVDLKNFSSLAQIRTYFKNKIDIFAKLAYVRSECAQCKFNLADKCSICFAYKLSRMNEIREYCSLV